MKTYLLIVFQFLSLLKEKKVLDIEEIKKYIGAMKKIIIPILAVIALSTAFATAYLDFFFARSEGDNVKLEWRTGEEHNVQHFIVERKTISGNFIDVATITAKGSNSYYTYVDESAYKSQDLIFIYRLKIVSENNSTTFSSEVSVSHSISGIKRTWGSIKAMFR